MFPLKHSQRQCTESIPVADIFILLAMSALTQFTDYIPSDANFHCDVAIWEYGRGDGSEHVRGC
jgi:hypothetical protein